MQRIFRDTSIFGYYKCFIDLQEMRELLQYRTGEVSSYGLVLDQRGGTEEITSLYSALAERLPMVPPITVKEECATFCCPCRSMSHRWTNF
ncbi:MAG: hypothetical protein B6241_13850 [Spirochaetaceae bacterium 4572_59]|nr:MAG: hypothetical protein B6241_13850 [Spirochaetaceae bacterium 4572_59]